jgi:hypothetical protein
MRIPITILIAGLVALPLRPDDSPKRAATLVADTLDWYSTWFGLDQNTLRRQTCRGEFRATLYTFRCDPLAVVVSAAFDDSGRCSIVSTRPSISPEDGLHVNTLSNLAHLTPPPKTSVAPPRDCGELPTIEGAFELTLIPRSREVDDRLTKAARVVALAYVKRGGDRPCVLYFPKVRLGDPFVHVYEVCQGDLDEVMEFMIRNGRVDDFAHWSYDRPHKNLPPGAKRRLERRDLWSGVSHPEERRQRPQ